MVLPSPWGVRGGLKSELQEVRHACLDACPLTNVLQIGEDRVVVTESLFELLVSITVALHLLHELVKHVALCGIVHDGSLVEFCQFLRLGNGSVESTQLIHQSNLLGVNTSPHTTFTNLLDVVLLHLSAVCTTLREEFITVVDVPLSKRTFLFGEWA